MQPNNTGAGQPKLLRDNLLSGGCPAVTRRTQGPGQPIQPIQPYNQIKNKIKNTPPAPSDLRVFYKEVAKMVVQVG